MLLPKKRGAAVCASCEWLVGLSHCHGPSIVHCTIRRRQLRLSYAPSLDSGVRPERAGDCQANTAQSHETPLVGNPQCPLAALRPGHRLHWQSGRCHTGPGRSCVCHHQTGTPTGDDSRRRASRSPGLAGRGPRGQRHRPGAMSINGALLRAAPSERPFLGWPRVLL
jgi:hypothetical protein